MRGRKIQNTEVQIMYINSKDELVAQMMKYYTTLKEHYIGQNVKLKMNNFLISGQITRITKACLVLKNWSIREDY